MNEPQYEVRLAAPEDVGLLPEIERVAGLQFKAYKELGIPDEMFDAPNPVETFAAAQQAGQARPRGPTGAL